MRPTSQQDPMSRKMSQAHPDLLSARHTAPTSFPGAGSAERVAQVVSDDSHCGSRSLPRAVKITPRHAAKMLQRLHDIAATRGGRCLSESYGGGYDLGRFACAQGHEWDTAFRLVLDGSWCPACMRIQGDTKRRVADGLKRLQALAASRGGECLSDSYLGTKVRYQMRCAEGHEWDALGSSLQRGSWCWVCHQVSRRKGLQAMQDVAAVRGGQCLSSHYLHSSQKLTWLCHVGHTWQASWVSVQRHWCPECAHLDRITNAKSKARRRYVTNQPLVQDSALDVPAAYDAGTQPAIA